MIRVDGKSPAKLSALIDARVISCCDNLDQPRKLSQGCVAGAA
jgi:hypothetical protein